MTRDLKSEPQGTSSTSPGTESKSTELKIYQTFIFAAPIFFIFILLFLFYLFYLRRRRVDWRSLRMRASLEDNIDTSPQVELGLKKEIREMLPVLVYKESFSVSDTQCPVCLGDYQPEDRLQQLPACGHTYHMKCIDSWLSKHITCPLCRLSLLPSAKVHSESQDHRGNVQQYAAAVDNSETSSQPVPESRQESVLRDEESGTTQNNAEEEAKTSRSAGH